MTRNCCIWTLVLLLSACGASSTYKPNLTFPGPAPPSTPAPQAAWHGIWEAALSVYLTGITTEADIVARSSAIAGTNPGRKASGKTPVVLWSFRHEDEEPYDSIWATGLQGRGLADGYCTAERLRHCPDSILTTFVELREPVLIRGDTAVVILEETGLNPAECRRRGVFMGFNSKVLSLVRASETWVVVGFRSDFFALSGSGFCSPDD